MSLIFDGVNWVKSYQEPGKDYPPPPGVDVDSSRNWGEQTAAEAGKGLHYFKDLGVIAYNDGNNFNLSGQVRDNPVKIATFGDSTASVGNTSFPANQDTSVSNTNFPASGTSSAVMSPIFWRLTEKYPMAKIVFNGGIASEGLDDMIARDLASYSITRRAVTDIISAGADMIIVRMGTNSLGNNVDTVFGYYTTLAERLLTAGAFVLFEGVQGRGFSGTVTSQQPYLLDLNSRVKAYIESLKNYKVRYLDPIGILCDSTGAYLPGMTQDETHLGLYGQDVLADEEAKVLNSLFGVSARVRYPGANQASNQLLLTTTAETYGTLATGFTPASSAYKTISEAAISLIDDVLMQTVKITPSGAGAAQLLFKLPIAIADLGTFSSGQQFGIEFDYFIEMITEGAVFPASTNMGISLSTKKVGAGTVAIFNTQLTTDASYTGGNSRVLRGHAVFNPIQINAADTELETISLSIFANYTLANSLVTNGIRFGAGGLRIVKL